MGHSHRVLFTPGRIGRPGLFGYARVGGGETGGGSFRSPNGSRRTRYTEEFAAELVPPLQPHRGTFITSLRTVGTRLQGVTVQ